MAKDSRGSGGRFARGNPGGPGRPARQTEISYLLRLSEAVTPEVWGRIVQRAITDAIAGDPRARDFLARHLLPAPSGEALQREADREDYLRRKEAGELTWSEQMSEAWQ